MIQIFVPRNEMELSFAKSFLEAEGIPFYVLAYPVSCHLQEIPFYVQNEHDSGPIGFGVPIGNYSQKAIMVFPEFETAAKEALADFIKQIEPENKDSKTV